MIPNAVDVGAVPFGAAAPIPRCGSALGTRRRARCSASPARSTATKGSTCCWTPSQRACARASAIACAAGRRRTRRRPLLRAQAPPRASSDRVIFTGRVPHAEVQRYYELIDVLAYPRMPIRLTELVTPLKPLEAMAQGRMFVAVRCRRAPRTDPRRRDRVPVPGRRRRRAREPCDRRCSPHAANGRGCARDGAPLRRDRAHLGAQRRALRDVYQRPPAARARALSGRPEGSAHVRHPRHHRS